MGSQVKVICKCGVNKVMLIGGSRASFKHTQYFPCYCKNCRDIVPGNIQSKVLECPRCNSRGILPYNKRKLIGKKGNLTIAQNFDFILTNGTYKCPKCENMTLYFEDGDLMFD